MFGHRIKLPMTEATLVENTIMLLMALGILFGQRFIRIFALKINTMKQLRSILLLLLFLHSKIGVALNVHYCGGLVMLFLGPIRLRIVAWK